MNLGMHLSPLATTCGGVAPPDDLMDRDRINLSCLLDQAVEELAT